MTFWAVHIPYVENKLEISHSTIGFLILVLGGGALVASQLVGHFIDRVGSKTATFLSALIMGLMMLLPGLATDSLTLGLSLFVLGFGI